DTPKQMVNTIRQAFDATMKDPAFLAEAQKSLFDVDPLTGEEMERILQRAYATPKALIRRAAELNGSGGLLFWFNPPPSPPPGPPPFLGICAASGPKPGAGRWLRNATIFSPAAPELRCRS